MKDFDRIQGQKTQTLTNTYVGQFAGGKGGAFVF